MKTRSSVTPSVVSAAVPVPVAGTLTIPSKTGSKVAPVRSCKLPDVKRKRSSLTKDSDGSDIPVATRKCHEQRTIKIDISKLHQKKQAESQTQKGKQLKSGSSAGHSSSSSSTPKKRVKAAPDQKGKVKQRSSRRANTLEKARHNQAERELRRGLTCATKELEDTLTKYGYLREDTARKRCRTPCSHTKIEVLKAARTAIIELCNEKSSLSQKNANLEDEQQPLFHLQGEGDDQWESESQLEVMNPADL